MTSIRILSYNAQLRSWMMQVGASESFPPSYTSEERATLIGAAIVGSPRDYDIVGLCEVFDEGARDILSTMLSIRFPYQITKATETYIKYRSPAEPEGYLSLPVTYALVGKPPGVVDMSYRLEDSGLMLFSRWPVDVASTDKLTPAEIGEAAAEGIPVGAAIPATSFLPYNDAVGSDKHASKGVLYLRVKRSPADRPYHVFLSHTQADDNKVQEHQEQRARQLDAVGKFMVSCAGPLPFAEETFFMGDLNVCGEQENTAKKTGEWFTSFASFVPLLSTQVVDLWGRRQCVGPPGLRDPGYSATAVYSPPEQRLDYIFSARNSALAAQHLRIDYDLAQVPPGHPGVSYLSDHRPLAADFASPRPNSTPAGAQVVAPAALFRDKRETLRGGQVKWYRFDTAGTYDFVLYQGADKCGFEVYLDTDLSRPRQQYRKESGGPRIGDKYVLASAPFLVKVFAFDRAGEAIFGFQAHKHQGLGPNDAIQIPYGTQVSDEFPSSGQALNDDFAKTPWNDRDTKWFRIDAPTMPLSQPMHVSLTVDTTGVKSGVSIVRTTAGGGYKIEQHQQSLQHYALDFTLSLGDVVYVQVHRMDGLTPGPLKVSLLAETNVSILLGGQLGAPTMVCAQETSGWGSDDIELAIYVDGTLYRHISNDEIGDFDDDDVRYLNPWIPEVLPYFNNVMFQVIELDDIDPNDVGQETLPPRKELPQCSHFIVTDDTAVMRGAIPVKVDDGLYYLMVSVTTWDERF